MAEVKMLTGAAATACCLSKALDSMSWANGMSGGGQPCGDTVCCAGRWFKRQQLGTRPVPE